MSLITRMRRQKAVYWERTGHDEAGQPTYAAPVEINCRWEDTSVEFMDKEQRRVLSNAKVYVDRVMPLGSALWRGLLADVHPASASDPFLNEFAYEVRMFKRLPNIRATEELLTAML
jgi:hypothetical protein